MTCEKDGGSPSGSKESDQAKGIYQRPRRDHKPAYVPDSSLALHSGIDDRREEDPDYGSNKDGKDKATYPEHLKQHYPTEGYGPRSAPTLAGMAEVHPSGGFQPAVSRSL